MTTATLAHEVTTEFENGRYRAVCSCKWRSTKTYTIPSSARAAAEILHRELQG